MNQADISSKTINNTKKAQFDEEDTKKQQKHANGSIEMSKSCVKSDAEDTKDQALTKNQSSGIGSDKFGEEGKIDNGSHTKLNNLQGRGMLIINETSLYDFE